MLKLTKLLAVAAVGLSTLVPSLALAYDRVPRGEDRHERVERREVRERRDHDGRGIYWRQGDRDCRFDRR